MMDEVVEQKPPYQYVMVRDDLPLNKQGVHIQHAGGESVLTPLSELTHSALFAAGSEPELLAQAAKVEAAGFRVKRIHEPEGPEYGRGYVSFGVEVSNRHNKLRKLFHHCRMWDPEGQLRKCFAELGIAIPPSIAHMFARVAQTSASAS